MGTEPSLTYGGLEGMGKEKKEGCALFSGDVLWAWSPGGSQAAGHPLWAQGPWKCPPPRPRASLTGFYLSPVSVTIAQRPIRTKEGLDSWVLADHFRTGGWVDF